jgi:hypothetical protein
MHQINKRVGSKTIREENTQAFSPNGPQVTHARRKTLTTLTFVPPLYAPPAPSSSSTTLTHTNLLLDPPLYRPLAATSLSMILTAPIFLMFCFDYVLFKWIISVWFLKNIEPTNNT